VSGRSVIRVAHRGASALFPENTLLVFRQVLTFDLNGFTTNRPDMLNKVLHDVAI